MRRGLAASAVVALVFTLAGCGGDPAPKPKPIATGTPSVTASATPAWTKQYTSTQLKAYGEALAVWNQYENEAQPIWASGKATPAARALFNRFFDPTVAVGEFNTLRFYEENQLQVLDLPKVLSSRATRIKVSGTGGSVSIRQCADYRNARGLQSGKPTKNVMKTPVVRVVELVKESSHWVIVKDPTIGKANGAKSCAG